MKQNASRPRTNRELLLILSKNIEVIQKDTKHNYDRLDDMWKLLYGFDENNPGLKQKIHDNSNAIGYLKNSIKSIKYRFWWFLGCLLPIIFYFMAQRLVNWLK